MSFGAWSWDRLLARLLSRSLKATALPRVSQVLIRRRPACGAAATRWRLWRFWQPGFFQGWLAQVDLEIFQNHLDSNPPRAARAYAYETIAQHDATLACWDSKYIYLELRPSQADPSITTLFANPQHPGFPSGHACASGASAAVMSVLFPADEQSFTTMANDAGTSTFDAGIHTQLDVSQGLALGTLVGQKVAARASADGAN